MDEKKNANERARVNENIYGWHLIIPSETFLCAILKFRYQKKLTINLFLLSFSLSTIPSRSLTFMLGYY
jgi:hypothetical protein